MSALTRLKPVVLASLRGAAPVHRRVLAWLPARSRLRGRLIRRLAPYDPGYAVAAYVEFNRERGEPDEELRAIIARAMAFGYLEWAMKVVDDIRGRDVLDVGCGTGFQALGYVVAGVATYTGVDPRVDLDGDLAKNTRDPGDRRFGWTLRQLVDRFPQMGFHPGVLEAARLPGSFDVAALHNVTEHLMDIETVFGEIHAALRDQGRILFNHHNYYCWNGHHRPPQTVSAIDPNDPEQARFLDWAHLDLTPEADEYLARGLNRIRLDALRELTERYFVIESWEERESAPETGRGRLTDAIRRRHPEYSERELLVQDVFCRARRRGEPMRRMQAERERAGRPRAPRERVAG